MKQKNFLKPWNEEETEKSHRELIQSFKDSKQATIMTNTFICTPLSYIFKQDTFTGNIICVSENKKVYLDFLINGNIITVSERKNPNNKFTISMEDTFSNLTRFINLYLYSNIEAGFLIQEFCEVPKRFAFKNQQTTDMIVYGLLNNEIYFLIGRRKYPPVGWGLFGGMIEEDEDAEINSNKEFEEETNLKKSDIKVKKFFETQDHEEIRGTLQTSIYLIELTEQKIANIQNYLEAEKDLDDILEVRLVSFTDILQLQEQGAFVPHHFKIISQVYNNFKLLVSEKE